MRLGGVCRMKGWDKVQWTGSLKNSDPTRKDNCWKFQTKTSWQIVTSSKNQTLSSTRMWEKGN